MVREEVSADGFEFSPGPRAGDHAQQLAELWRRQAPLGWDVSDPVPVARTICWLLSDYSQGISGEIVHVDGGFHAVGAPAQPA